jgi:hypothetical protein
LFAKNLEFLFVECCEQCDFSHANPAEIAERFESLRAYGRLPRGRENRARHLSLTEISAAILGLVPPNPKWAGHAAVVLSNLQPVGGSGTSFAGATTLIQVIEKLLADSGEQNGFLHLTLSGAERATNSNGFGALVYQQNGVRRRTSFVSRMALSLFQPGAESALDAELSQARISRCIVFNQAFFRQMAKAIARSIALSEAPLGDGSEYDAEEARQARYQALGVQRGSRFLNIGVDTQVAWPAQERLVQFDQYHVVFMPKTEEHTQSIHVDLHANRLSREQAVTVANRLLSVLAWCDDQFAITQGGWSGNPVPLAVPKRNLAFAIADYSLFDRCIPQSDEARRALALYREGRNAEEAELISYAVLSYFKIIEIKHPDGRRAKKWIALNFSSATSAPHESDRIQRFMAECGSKPPEDYIYDACRVAVAHASIKHPSDADDSEEITRLYSASYVLRLLARHLISKELGVSDSIYSEE